MNPLRIGLIKKKLEIIIKTISPKRPLTLTDLENACTILGIHLIKAPLIECKGFTYCDNGKHYIVLNTDTPDSQQPLILAHELGHILMEHSNQPVGTVNPDIVAMLEAEADIFAHHLIHPNAS